MYKLTTAWEVVGFIHLFHSEDGEKWNLAASWSYPARYNDHYTYQMLACRHGILKALRAAGHIVAVPAEIRIRLKAGGGIVQLIESSKLTLLASEKIDGYYSVPEGQENEMIAKFRNAGLEAWRV